METDLELEMMAAADKDVVTTTGQWMSAVAVAIGAFALVTSEFLPVGLLPEIARSVDVPIGVAGLMLTAPGIIAAVAAPVIVVTSGGNDRKHVLLALSVMLLLSDLLSALSPNFFILLVARAVLGVCLGGFWTVALATAGRLVAKADRARATAIVLSGISGATVVGLPLGTYIGSLVGWRASFFATAVLVVLGICGQAAFLKQALPGHGTRWRDFPSALKNPGMRYALLGSTLIIAAHLAAYTYITPYLIDVARLSVSTVPYVLLGFGVLGFFANLAISGPLARSVEVWLFILIGLFAASFLLLRLSPGLSLVVPVLVIWAVCSGAIMLGLNIWVGRHASHYAEAASALYVSAVQIAIAMGALAGGTVVDAVGISSNFTFAFVLACAALAPLAAQHILHRSTGVSS